MESLLKEIGEQSPFEALGVSPHCTDDEVRASFMAATKQWHPVKFARCDAEQYKLANEIFIALKKAFEAIKTSSAREREAKRYGERFSPQTQVSSPPPLKQLPERKKPTNVSTGTLRGAPLPSLQSGAAMSSDDSSLLETAKDHLRSKSWKLARLSLQQLVTKRPADKAIRALLHAALGFEKLEQGELAHAVAAFQHATKLNPNLRLAKKGMQQIAAKAAAGQK